MLAVTDPDLRVKFSADSIDAPMGIIRGATVAKANVEATGKFVMIDKAGRITFDPEEADHRLQVTTDSTTLDTIMTAAAAMGGRLKVRSDHDDALGSRAGYADNFKRIGDLIACDLHLFDAYKDRAIVLETAAETPDQIGLSIDCLATYAIKSGQALMRVTKLEGVDIVDGGAITPNGLFMSKAVDKKHNTEPTTISKMAKSDEAPDKIDQCLSAITALTTAHTALAEKFEKLNPPAKPVKADDSDSTMSAALKENALQLAKVSADFAAFKASTETASSVQAESIAKLNKERAALGLKADAEGKVQAAAGSADDKGEGKGKTKTYIELVAEHAATSKMSKSESHRVIMKSNPAAYAAHLAAIGAVKAK